MEVIVDESKSLMTFILLHIFIESVSVFISIYWIPEHSNCSLYILFDKIIQILFAITQELIE